MYYILNSAVLTTSGTYEYTLINSEEATNWIQDHNFLCTIGYQETVDALKTLIRDKSKYKDLVVNRQQIKMNKGDEALVFRLTIRLNDPKLKGSICDKDFILQNSEIGLLKKKQ